MFFVIKYVYEKISIYYFSLNSQWVQISAKALPKKICGLKSRPISDRAAENRNKIKSSRIFESDFGNDYVPENRFVVARRNLCG